MPHRFTEPTPASAHHVHAEVFISSWEIECCAPPPVVGRPSTWTLQFISAEGPYPVPELDRDRAWTVTRHGVSTCLEDGPLLALWSDFDRPPPEPGRATLRGHLLGTVHGPLPDDIPTTTGTVQRIRLASQVYAPHGERELRPVANTLTLTDISESPRWFSLGDGPIDKGTKRREQTGVLLDLAVPRN